MRLTTRRTARARGRTRGALAATTVALFALGLAGPATASAGGEDGAAPVAALGGPAPEATVAVAEDAGEPQPVAVAVVEKADGSLKVETYQTGSVAAAGRVAAELDKRSDVVAAEVDHTVSALAVIPSNDPWYPCQWALRTSGSCDLDGDGEATPYSAPRGLDAANAWQDSTGAGVTVAVVDSGVDGTHEDLTGRVRSGYQYARTSEGKAVFKALAANSKSDFFGHGTHVAGIIAARDNSVGVVGLAPGATIMPVRVLNTDGGGFASDVARGMIWAVDHGADVINLSLGGVEQSDAQTAAIRYALSKGVLVVAAAGNFYKKNPYYPYKPNPVFWPAATPGVLAVGATDINGKAADFSERRSYVAVAAPGVDILSTCLQGRASDPELDPCYATVSPQAGRYSLMQGTSMAAPYVTAAAALLLQANPNLSPAALSAYLTGTATDAGTTGRDSTFGFGHLNVNKALDQVIDGTKRPTAVVLTPSSTRVRYGTTISLKASVWSGGYRLPYRKVAFQRLNLNGTWTTLGSASTNPGGDATFKVKLSRHTRYRAVAWEVTGLAKGTSDLRTVAVYAKITRSGSSPSADRVTITAQAYPKAKVTLKLQRKVGSTWKTISTRTTSSTGAVTFSKIKAPTGKRYFRVIGGKSSLAGSGKSSTLTLKVK